MRFTEGESCPACGRGMELESLMTGPGQWRYVPGRAFCPSECDPRSRRVVVAASYRMFEIHCRAHQWDPRKIIYISSTEVSRMTSLRGVRTSPHMITILDYPRPEIWRSIMLAIQNSGHDVRDLLLAREAYRRHMTVDVSMFGDSTRVMMEIARSDDVLQRQDVSPDARVVDPEEVLVFSRDRMTAAIDEALRYNEEIINRHRSEEDPFPWGDSMSST